MTADGFMPLEDIARREEHRAAAGVAEVADLHRSFAGGIASRGAPGAWTNTALAAGLDGAVDPNTIDDQIRELIAWYAKAGIEPRVELAPYADPALVNGLSRARFVIRYFETVFMRSTAGLDDLTLPMPTPDDVSIERVDPNDDAAVDRFARVVLSGFVPHLTPLPEDQLEVNRRVAHHSQTTSIVARCGGEVVGGGSVEVAGAIAALYGLSVVPHARRRGIQQAMMLWRLKHAAARGASIVTISARPLVATERNARRLGFQVAYTKALVVRPGEGLAPVL